MAQALAEKLEHTGLPKRKEWPQCHKESSWQVRRSHLCRKEKSHLSRSPDREVEESQGEREPHLNERGGIRAAVWRGEGGFHSKRRQIPGR